MLSLVTYREIIKNPLWRPHITIVQAFSCYLTSKKDMKFRVSGISQFEGDEFTVTRELPYIHRWTDLYKKSVLAKFYQLEAYIKEHPADVITLLTLTTYHAYDQFGRPSKISTTTIPESFGLLKNGWNGIRDSLNYRKLQYVWILEPHKTGYPHIHVCILGKVIQKDQQKIINLWHKYGCGSLEHGAQFSEKKGNDSVKSIRNYLMKYMVKAWHDSEWTTAQLVFNSLVWHNNWRLWGSSKNLTIIMRNRKIKETNIDWQLTELLTGKNSEYMDIWRKEIPMNDWEPEDYGWQGKLSQIKPFVADYSQPTKPI
jgi:hypothetical protein